MPAHVVLQDLDKHFEEGGARRRVLTRASIAIDRGTIVAIQGRSGSGKTTLLNLVAGLDLPDAGVVRVDGRELQAMNDRDRTLFRRRHCGFVFQFFNLISTLTARENVMIGLELNGSREAEARQRADALMKSVGLGERGDSFPDRLSGGEQQRVALARALAHGPGLLLADEPTGNLDAATELEMLELIRALPREHRTTVLIATHSELVAGYADRVITLEGGALVEP